MPSEIINISKLNEVFARVICSPGVAMEIRDAFTYRKENTFYNPKNRFANKTTISLFNTFNKTILVGLVPFLTEFLRKRNYQVKLEGDFLSAEFSLLEAQEFIQSLNLPFQPDEYQIKYFIKAVRNHRAILESPTGSGKSLILYMIYRYFDSKTLLLVPTLSLINQITEDFISYGCNLRDISTKLQIINYQAISNEDKNWFDQFDIILCDECHQYEAKTLQHIMTQMLNTPVRIGVTGTLPDDDLRRMTIQGHFGPACKYVTTKELINQGRLSNLLIKMIVLHHQDAHLEQITTKEKDRLKWDYQKEIEYLNNLEKRIIFIRNLALSLTGNILIMFREIEAGMKIHESIKNKLSFQDEKLFFISGQDTPVEERERIRHILDSSTGNICVCSTVFQTGINIKSIDNIIFYRPSKSRIRVMQSIGRGLRKLSTKKQCTLFDIADDISPENGNNITLKHAAERMKMYDQEEFDYKIYSVNI